MNEKKDPEPAAQNNDQVLDMFVEQAPNKDNKNE